MWLLELMQLFCCTKEMSVWEHSQPERKKHRNGERNHVFLGEIAWTPEPNYTWNQSYPLVHNSYKRHKFSCAQSSLDWAFSNLPPKDNWIKNHCLQRIPCLEGEADKQIDRTHKGSFSVDTKEGSESSRHRGWGGVSLIPEERWRANSGHQGR